MFSRKQIAIGLVACLAAALHSAQAADSWTPIMSKLRRTVTEIPPDGPAKVNEVWEGVFLRTHDGSRLEKLERIRPWPYAAAGIFDDRPQGKVYRLAYPTKTAVLEHDAQPSSRPNWPGTTSRLRDSNQQTEVIAGIPCSVAAIQVGMPGGVGKSCYNREYDLTLYFEVDLPDGSGGFVRHRQEHYDLEIGRTPPPGEVALPEGFVLQENVD